MAGSKTGKRSRAGQWLLLVLIIAGLIFSYEFVQLGQWRTLVDIRPDLKFEHVETLFGPPPQDIGSGLHVYRYETWFGHILVGTPDNDQVFYIRYQGLFDRVTDPVIHTSPEAGPR